MPCWASLASDALEKTFDKILLAGIPCMAVPLLSHGCRDTSADLDWVREMIRMGEKGDSPHLCEAPSGPFRQMGTVPFFPKTRTYLHLMLRGGPDVRAGAIGPPPAIGPQRRAGESTKGTVPFSSNENWDSPQLDLPPLAATEAIARGFLASGGKHFRPFITLAVHDAADGRAGHARRRCRACGPTAGRRQRIALAMEVASQGLAGARRHRGRRLVSVTAGRALHREFGPAVALNVGDYLIGLGYRLAAAQQDAGAGGRGRHPGRVRPGPYAALRGPGGRVGMAGRPRSAALAAGRAEDSIR